MELYDFLSQNYHNQHTQTHTDELTSAIQRKHLFSIIVFNSVCFVSICLFAYWIFKSVMIAWVPRVCVCLALSQPANTWHWWCIKRIVELIQWLWALNSIIYAPLVCHMNGLSFGIPIVGIIDWSLMAIQCDWMISMIVGIKISLHWMRHAITFVLE